jgi:hypothetical protein
MQPVRESRAFVLIKGWLPLNLINEHALAEFDSLFISMEFFSAAMILSHGYSHRV